MKLSFLGANRQVTGSCYLLEAAGARVVIDCGMYQERALLERNWQRRPVEAARVDAVVLTHAHLDHTGLLPRLVREGFAGPIWATAPTVDLTALILRDSARIQEEDAAAKAKRHRKEKREGRHPEVPLYTADEAEEVIPHLRGVPFREPVEVAPGLTLRFLEAGHILGAAILDCTVRENGARRRIVFSGDLGQWDIPIVPDPAVVESADFVVLESTYGDGDHDRSLPVPDALADEVADAARRGGNLVIPTFAVERTQELLLHLGELAEAKRIPRVRIFVDSPMAADATAIYGRHPDFMDERTRAAVEGGRFAGARRMLEFVRSAEESKALNALGGTSVILAGSGMCTGGRIKHHLRHNIERSESTILFVGYQAEGTLGREIVDGAPTVRILGLTQTVRAKVREIRGLSGHADRRQLLFWLEHFARPPARLFLTHGEEAASLALSKEVGERLRWDVAVPRYLDEVDL